MIIESEVSSIKEKEKNMIYIYDVFTDLYGNEKFKLDPYELYLYCYLYRSRSFELIANTSVDYIHMSAALKMYPSVEHKNRSMIKNKLLSLRSKNIISFDCAEEILLSRKGNNYPLSVVFSKGIFSGGYIKVPYETFDKMRDIHDFYITIAVSRYNNVNALDRYSGRWISEKEFGSLLGVSKSTFRRYADKMIEDGLLYKMSGVRDGGLEQDKNIYRTIPFDDVSSKERRYKDRVYPKDQLFSTIIGEGLTIAEIKEQFDSCSWGKKDKWGMYEKIEKYDYECYRVCVDLGVRMKKVRMCEDVIEKLKNNDIYKEKFEIWEREYLREVSEIRRGEGLLN